MIVIKCNQIRSDHPINIPSHRISYITYHTYQIIHIRSPHIISYYIISSFFFLSSFISVLPFFILCQLILHAFYTYQQYPKKKTFWRGGNATTSLEIINVLKELNFFLQYLDEDDKIYYDIAVNSPLPMDDCYVGLLDLLLFAEENKNIEIKLENQKNDILCMICDEMG